MTDITGRCYCGRIQLSASEQPQTVAYCHCEDCRRVTGAPVAAFAAFRDGALSLSPDITETSPAAAGVKRRFCPDCGSALTARFDYLPDQIYVPIGILDQAESFPPNIHCHADKQLKWLHIQDEIERSQGSGRAQLTSRAQ